MVLAYLYLILFLCSSLSASESSIPVAPPFESTEATPKERKAKKAKEAKETKETEAALSQSYQPPIIVKNVTIIADNSEKTTGDDPGPETIDFATALCQQAGPIIVTGHTLYALLKWYHRVLPPDEEEFLKKEAPFHLNLLIKQLRFDDETWQGYKTTDGIWYVFVPVSYKKRMLAQYDTPEFREYVAKHSHHHPEDIILDLAVDPEWSGLKKVPPTQLTKKFDKPEDEQLLFASIRKDTPYTVRGLKPLFVHGKTPLFGIINVALFGHGFYPHKMVEQAALHKPVREVATKQETVSVEGATIAGWPIVQYRELQHFFTHDMNTNFVYVNSCYAGDINLYLPHLTFINDKGTHSGGVYPPYTVVNGALTASQVIAEHHPLSHEKNNLFECIHGQEISVGYENFRKFFALLEQYSNRTTIHPTRFNDTEMREILLAITPRYTTKHDPWGISGLPQVMYPGTQHFTLFQLDPDIVIITKVLLAKHKESKTPLTIKNKKVIALYPTEVDVPLVIETATASASSSSSSSSSSSTTDAPPALVSMAPGLVLHHIDELVTTSTFSDFLHTTMGSVSPGIPKYFLIRKLQVLNDTNGVPGVEGPVQLSDVFITVAHQEVNAYYTAPSGSMFKTRMGYHQRRDMPPTYTTENVGKRIALFPEHPLLALIILYRMKHDKDVVKLLTEHERKLLADFDQKSFFDLSERSGLIRQDLTFTTPATLPKFMQLSLQHVNQDVAKYFYFKAFTVANESFPDEPLVRDVPVGIPVELHHVLFKFEKGGAVVLFTFGNTLYLYRYPVSFVVSDQDFVRYVEGNNLFEKDEYYKEKDSADGTFSLVDTILNFYKQARHGKTLRDWFGDIWNIRGPYDSVAREIRDQMWTKIGPTE